MSKKYLPAFFSLVSFYDEITGWKYRKISPVCNWQAFFEDREEWIGKWGCSDLRS